MQLAVLIGNIATNRVTGKAESVADILLLVTIGTV
jgi:hypothetical protein